jgi:NAD(P)-dependent dehydrogenase (short-subunit alcohol dehydrogenase family)
MEEEGKKVVLLTGCSSGLGLETAVELARKQFMVYASMRTLSMK